MTAVLKERAEKKQSLFETARRLYASRMAQAAPAWETRDYGTLGALLDDTTPSSLGYDFRGWEWHFFRSQLDQQFVDTPEAYVSQAAWHPHANEIAVVVAKGQRDSAIEFLTPGARTATPPVAELPGIPAWKVTGLRWSDDGSRIAVATHLGRSARFRCLDAAHHCSIGRCTEARKEDPR